MTEASEKADALYPQSPRINSELINRIKPSSNSVAALKAMIEHQGQVRLGIEGFPAEGGLFETLLTTTGLYEETNQGLAFRISTVKNDPARLQPLWDVADRFFKKNQNRAIPITDLYHIWTSRPYGVKDGLLPFFAMVYLLTHQYDYAVYHAKIYRPSIEQKILAGTAETLNRLHPNLSKLSETSEPLEIARRLVMTVMDLPSWILRTRQLSANTIRLRELIKNANDPHKVLFDDLPSLFKEYEQNFNKGDVQPIMRDLDQSLNELVAAYPKLMDDLRQQLLDELQIDSKGKFALEEIHLRAKNIMHVSGDFKLDAFAARLSTFKDTEADIEGLASLAADKPTRDWIDLDVSCAKLRIAELSQKFNHTEAYGRVHNREDYRQAIAFMVGLNGKPKTFVREFTVKQTEQKMVREIEEKLSKLLFSEIEVSDDLMLAVLANIGARILEKEETHKSKRGYP